MRRSQSQVKMSSPSFSSSSSQCYFEPDGPSSTFSPWCVGLTLDPASRKSSSEEGQSGGGGWSALLPVHLSILPITTTATASHWPLADSKRIQPQPRETPIICAFSPSPSLPWLRAANHAAAQPPRPLLQPRPSCPSQATSHPASRAQHGISLPSSRPPTFSPPSSSHDSLLCMSG